MQISWTIFVKGELDEYSCAFSVRTYISRFEPSRLCSKSTQACKTRKRLPVVNCKYTECTCTLMTTRSAPFLAPQAWRGREGFLSMHFHVSSSNKMQKHFPLIIFCKINWSITRICYKFVHIFITHVVIRCFP